MVSLIFWFKNNSCHNVNAKSIRKNYHCLIINKYNNNFLINLMSMFKGDRTPQCNINTKELRLIKISIA